MTVLSDKVATYDASVPDWQIANELNTPDPLLPKKRVDVNSEEIRRLLLVDGGWAKIVIAAEATGTTQATRELCVTVIESLKYLTQFKMSVTATYNKIDTAITGLVTAGFIDQAMHDKIMALAEDLQSWAEANNGGVLVTARDVGLARGAKP